MLLLNSHNSKLQSQPHTIAAWSVKQEVWNVPVTKTMKRRAQGQNASVSKVRKKDMQRQDHATVKTEPNQLGRDETEVPEGRPGVVVVYDRKINLHKLGPDPSMFELCRAWVQDDPDRPQVTVCCVCMLDSRGSVVSMSWFI